MEKELTTQNNWKVWQSFLLEAIVIAFLWFVGGKMQMAWGMTGLVLTELGFVIIALLTALVHKTPVKEVFPVAKITGKEVFATFILMVSGMMFSVAATGFSLVLIPNAMDEVTALSEFLYDGSNILVSIVTIAIIPAICEEMLHRGAIFSHLRGMKKDWQIVAIMGLFFGLFHLSPTKFLSTAILGMMLTYLMVKKNNIILPMLYHFMNNFFSTIVGSSSTADPEATAQALESLNKGALLGAYMIMGCLGPILLVVARKMISPETHQKKHFLYAGIVSAVLLIGGIIICGVAAVESGMVPAM